MTFAVQTVLGVGDEGALVAGVIALVVVACAAIYEAAKKRFGWGRGRSSVAGATPPAQARLLSERERLLSAQHARMSELAAAKLQAEITLLSQHAKWQAHEEDGLYAAKEQQELLAQKVKLEIEVLRLQIHEQRKRIDEWGST